MTLKGFTRTLAALGAVFTLTLTHAQELSEADLIRSLREGGVVILMRHASAPRQAPDESTRHPDNLQGERQLDTAGQDAAIAAGETLARLGIMIGEIDVSPTFRARQTATLMGFPDATVYPELSNEGMLAANSDQAEWLLREVTRPVASGNRLIVTHAPNIAAAFPGAGQMADGEALVIDPRDSAHPAIVGRVPIERWPALVP